MFLRLPPACAQAREAVRDRWSEKEEVGAQQPPPSFGNHKSVAVSKRQRLPSRVGKGKK